MKRIIKYILDSYLIRKNQIRIKSVAKIDVLNLIFRLHPVRVKQHLVRLGPTDDGGYLLPDDFLDIEACFSPGVYEITKFEYDCYALGMKLFLADKSIDSPLINIPKDKYEFIPKYLGAIDSADFITLDTWLGSRNINIKSDLILQMDIEGWEYLAILNASHSTMKRFRMMVIEFHNLNELWNPAFFNMANQTFSKILQTHTCVHIHPNNDSEMIRHNGIDIPPLMEFTFYRNDKVFSDFFENEFPNSLDCKNVLKKDDIRLPLVWYREGFKEVVGDHF